MVRPTAHHSKRFDREILRRGIPRLYVQAIFALAAALALSTAACSKNEGGGAPMPPAAPAKPTASPAPTGAAGAPAAAPQRVRARGGDVGRVVPPPQAESGREGDEVQQPPAPVQSAAPVSQTETEEYDSVVYYDFNGLTPDQIFKKKIGVIKGNAPVKNLVASDIRSANGELLFYSGSGQDTLREELFVMVNERLSKLSPAARESDRKFAHSIQVSHFSVDWENRRGFLTFVYNKNGVQMSTQVEGPINGGMGFRVENETLSAQVACMDISGGCRTAHIRVKDTSTGHVRTADIIARHTSTSMTVVPSNELGATNNRGFDHILGILKNSENKANQMNVIENMTLSTSETIGGASGFWVTMHTRLQDRQGNRGYDTLQLTGPLVKPHQTDDLDVRLLVTPAITVVNAAAVPLDGKRMVDMVGRASLLKNDGRGNLMVELVIPQVIAGAASGGREDKIYLFVSRRHTPTRGAQSDNFDWLK